MKIDLYYNMRFSLFKCGDQEGDETQVSRSINTVTFVAGATASSSRSDDDAMSTCIVEEERQRN